MQVEIGALVHKDCGPDVLDAMRETEGVAVAMIETGRSNDLFSDRQFGEYGEAAIITIIADEAAKMRSLIGCFKPVICLITQRALFI